MYKVLKTHARTRGNLLYLAGEFYDDNDMEDAAFKLKKGYIKKEYKKEEKEVYQTKQEKKTRKRVKK